MAEYPRIEVAKTNEIVVTITKPRSFEIGDFVVIANNERNWPNRIAMVTTGRRTYTALVSSRLRWIELTESYCWHVLRHATLSEGGFALTHRRNPDTI